VARELVEQGHEALVITPSLDQQEGYPFPVRSILFSPDEGGVESNGRLPFNFPCFTTHRLSTTKYSDLDEAQRAEYVASFESAILEEVNSCTGSSHLARA